MNKLILFLMLFAFQVNAQITILENNSKEYWDITVFCEGEVLYTGILNPGAQHCWIGYGRKIKLVWKLLTNECGVRLKSQSAWHQEAGYQSGRWIDKERIQLFNGPCGPKA